MTPEDFAQVRALFLGAKELAPAERETYLAQACAGCADLRSEVEALLKQVGGHRDKQLKAAIGRIAPVANQLCSELERAVGVDGASR